MTSEGFVKASSNNLPTVDMFMVMEFVTSDERFNAAEIRNVKATASGREEYGDNAVGYVELKREGAQCIVKCRICPEHKVRSKNYTVYLTVDEVEEKLVNVECQDCAAAAGGCKHALALLMWIHRRSEEPSPTDVTSYWKKPRLSCVGTSVKFVAAADFKRQAEGSTSQVLSGADTFCQELTTVAEAANLKGHILKYSSTTYEDTYESLAVYKLLFKFVLQGGSKCDDFLAFAINRMTQSLCMQGERQTRDQYRSPLWHELRFGRITASKLHEIAHCRTPDGTLIESVIGAYKVRDTKYMKRGRLLEKQVLKCVEDKMKCTFQACGFFTLPFFPVFGASPDGISQDCVVEVKCPSSEKGLFCVALPNFETSKEVKIIPVDFDEQFLNGVISEALNNWKEFVFPKLYESVK